MRETLPEDRLASTDEQGNRIKLHPADVRGRYQRMRSIVQFSLIGVFLALPWVRIAGHQAILLDVPKRRFAFFGLTFWAHDAPMIFFVLSITAVAVALVTATLGRVWCGWACPETVFIERIFRAIERWIEGDRVERIRLDSAPLSLSKIKKRALKWSLYVFFTLIISHSFLAYFVGTDALAVMIRQSPSSHPTAFAIMGMISATLLFAFGVFREQFCIILCPYGRMQSFLMDKKSLSIVYDPHRGEPRRGSQAKSEPQGDCIDCLKCVHVCPTGVDIRRGFQLECIACSACIDACDDVMTKIHRPRGLIRYDREKNSGPAYRNFAYGTLLVILLITFGVAVGARTPVQLQVHRAKDTPYQLTLDTAGGEQVSNHLVIHANNRTFGNVEFSAQLESNDLGSGLKLVIANQPVLIAPDGEVQIDAFILAPRSYFREGHAVAHLVSNVKLMDENKSTHNPLEIGLVGPF